MQWRNHWRNLVLWIIISLFIIVHSVQSKYILMLTTLMDREKNAMVAMVMDHGIMILTKNQVEP